MAACTKNETSGKQNSQDNAVPSDQMPSLPVENHLQSLGFVMNNGRPRFKMDNSDPTMEVPLTDFSIVNAEDTLSFEVLGKDSLGSIQASMLASYIDIEQKSKSIDYNSIISSFSSSEIQQKLTGLLEENVKLKETLKKNNAAMKQQFNTLAMWQEEVLKVHQNHKQKFAQTRELINHLKEESNSLKLKLSSNDFNDHMFKSMESSCSNMPIEAKVEQSARFLELQKKVSSLMNELSDLKRNCTKLTEDVQRYLSLSNLMSSQLKEANSTIEEQDLKIKKLQLAESMEESTKASNFILVDTPSSQDIQIQHWIEDCATKEKEIVELKQTVTLLNQQLHHTLVPVESSTETLSDNASHQGHQQFIQNVKQYDEKLRDLTECFIAQVSHYATMQKCLKDSTDTLEKCDTYSFPNGEQCQGDNQQVIQADIKVYKEKLSSIYNEFIKEQFQKLFSGYQSVLSELEVMQEENLKLSLMKHSSVHESLQKATELEKYKKGEIESLEEQIKVVNQEKHSLEEEKMLLDAQKKSLEMQQQNLLVEKELIQQEKINLFEEKTSLDQQSKLYDSNEKSLQDAIKKLQEQCDKLILERNLLESQLQEKDTIITGQKHIVKELKDEIDFVRTHIKCYEEDFEREKIIKQQLIQEKNKVNEDLQIEITLNQKLTQEINDLRSRVPGATETQNSDSTCLTRHYPCPNCLSSYTTVTKLTEHVEQCLNLN